MARGVEGYHQVLRENRMTGRSTAQALRYLAEAIENPHKYVEVEDHINQCRGLGGRQITKIDVELACMVGRFASRLNLEHIHVAGTKVVFERRAKIVVDRRGSTAQAGAPVLAADSLPEIPEVLEKQIEAMPGIAADLETIRRLMRKHGYRTAKTIEGLRTYDGDKLVECIAFSKE